jgi:hypothetical protein
MLEGSVESLGAPGVDGAPPPVIMGKGLAHQL